MIIEQIKAQLSRLVPVHKFHDLTDEGPFVEREMMLVKVAGKGDARIESLRLADIFRARVVNSTTDSFVFEMTGSAEKLNAFVSLMEPLGLVEISRTGAVAIARGAATFLEGCWRSRFAEILSFPRKREPRANAPALPWTAASRGRRFPEGDGTCGCITTAMRM